MYSLNICEKKKKNKEKIVIVTRSADLLRDHD